MNFWKASTFGLGGAFALTLAFATARPAHADPPPQPQLQMQTALELLKDAKQHLQNGTADKGGHRVKAIALTNDAIDEVKKGIEFDNKH